MHRTLVHHTRPIQCLRFSSKDEFLVSCSNFRECTIAVWDCSSFGLLASSYTVEFINDIKINNFCFNKEFRLEFTSVGRDCVYFWALNSQNKLEFLDIYVKGNQLTAVEILDF